MSTQKKFQSNGKWTAKLSSAPNASPQTSIFGDGSLGDISAVGDYDGDGKSDIAVYRPSSGTWYIFQSAANAFSSTHWGANGDIPLAMDTDGNGKSEITVYRPNGNVWFTFPSGAIQFGSPDDVPLSLN